MRAFYFLEQTTQSKPLIKVIHPNNMDIVLQQSTIVIFSIYLVCLGLSLSRSTLINERYFLFTAFTLLLSSCLFGMVNFATGLFLACAFLALSSHATKITEKYQGSVLLTTALLSLALAVHLVPGFNHTIIFGPATLPESSIPYLLKSNLDKAFGALLLLYLFNYQRRTLRLALPNHKEWALGIAGIGSILGIAYFMGVPWVAKFGELTIAFLFFNLFITCIAEESFFRLVIQEQLAKTRMPYWCPIVISAGIFTLAHFHTDDGAIYRLALIFLAGLLYAAIYHIRRNFIAAVLVHFLLNFLHFSFFAYPAVFQ